MRPAERDFIESADLLGTLLVRASPRKAALRRDAAGEWTYIWSGDNGHSPVTRCYFKGNAVGLHLLAHFEGREKFACSFVASLVDTVGLATNKQSWLFQVTSL